MRQKDRKEWSGIPALVRPGGNDTMVSVVAEIKTKLHPKRFPNMSPFMAAVVGYVLGESFTNPEIAEITVSEQENLVYIRKAGAVGFDGLQSLEDLRSNWNSLMDAAGLTADERKEAVHLFRARVETVAGTKL
jgi:hypothetical protein